MSALIFLMTGCPEAKRTPRGEAPPSRGSITTQKKEAPRHAAHAGTPSGGHRTSRRWPRFPRTTAEARELLRRRQHRPLIPDAQGALDARGVEKLLRARLLAGHVAAGWRAIVKRLQETIDAARARSRRVFLLVGTYHDARGQVDAFRRLVGALGIHGGSSASAPVALAIEQFDARGAWPGVSPSVQGGDTALLSRCLHGAGARAASALHALRARQARIDYTAWKYRYLPSLLDLVVMARARDQPLSPCDMPRALQGRAREIASDGLLLRLRELHCWLALTSSAPRAPVVAMLWGQDHVGPQGFVRFVPRDVEVLALYLYGHRATARGLEVALGRRVALTHPLLIPLSSAHHDARRYTQALLLLPGHRLSASWDQARDAGDDRGEESTTRERPSKSSRALIVTSTTLGRLFLANREISLRAETPRTLHLSAIPPGEAFLFRGRHGQVLAGSLELLHEGKTLKLKLDPPHRSVRAVVILR